MSLLALTPTTALAALKGSTDVAFPPTVTVGETNVPAAVLQQNLNDGAETGQTNTVCNSGDAVPCGGNGIVLTPSCGVVVSNVCQASGADPGVFQVSATASGRAGTACAGMTFETAVLDSTVGTVSFIPIAGAHVLLPQNESCVVDFSFDVLKMPSADSSPGTTGMQTTQLTEHTQTNGVSSRPFQDFDQTTVLPPATETGTGAGTGTGTGTGTNTSLAPDLTKPGLTMRLSRSMFRAAGSGPSSSATKKPLGSTVTFDLTEASFVKFSVDRKTKGRKVGRKCKAKTKANAKKKSCTRWVRVKGSFTVPGMAGKNRFTFRGRIGGTKLTPARYRLNSQATDPAKNKSVINRKGFRIVR